MPFYLLTSLYRRQKDYYVSDPEVLAHSHLDKCKRALFLSSIKINCSL